MWGASHHIQALAGLHASSSPATAADFLCAAAAAGTYVPAHAASLQPLLPRPPIGQSTADVGESEMSIEASPASASITATAAVPIVVSGSATAFDTNDGVGDGMQNIGAGSPRGVDHHARKPTLDDLCSLLLTANKQTH